MGIHYITDTIQPITIMEHNDIPNDLILKLNEVTADKEQQNGQYDELFREIAELLMKSYQIVNGADKFWIEEVEFYYYTPHSNDFRKQTPDEVGKPKGTLHIHVLARLTAGSFMTVAWI